MFTFAHDSTFIHLSHSNWCPGRARSCSGWHTRSVSCRGKSLTSPGLQLHNIDLLKLPPHPRRRRRVRSTRKRMQVRKSQGGEGGEGQVQVGEEDAIENSKEEDVVGEGSPSHGLYFRFHFHPSTRASSPSWWQLRPETEGLPQSS